MVVVEVRVVFGSLPPPGDSHRRGDASQDHGRALDYPWLLCLAISYCRYIKLSLVQVAVAGSCPVFLHSHSRFRDL